MHFIQYSISLKMQFKVDLRVFNVKIISQLFQNYHCTEEEGKESGETKVSKSAKNGKSRVVSNKTISFLALSEELEVWLLYQDLYKNIGYFLIKRMDREW